MRKNILFSAFFAATLLTGFASCSSSDDAAVAGGGSQIDVDNVVKDDQSAISLVNGVYSHWQPLSSSFSFIIENERSLVKSFSMGKRQFWPRSFFSALQDAGAL